MPNYIISQHIEAPNIEVASQVASRLQQGNETVTVPVTIGASTVEPTWMEVDTSIIDRIIKRVIAAAAIYYIGRGLKNWAKE